MSSKLGFGLLKTARLTRRQLVAFALVSAVVNGIVTAVIGGYLARTYAIYHERRQSIEGLASLFYARRTRAGMVVSSLRRNADLQEVRDRKRAYDDAYVDWNTNIRRNLFVIREVMGASQMAKLEQVFEDTLVAGLSDIDRCLTKAYDERMALRSPLPTLAACRMPETYQFVLDCGATFTNELYKMSQLTFLPFAGLSPQSRQQAEGRVRKGCTRPPAEPVVKDTPREAPVSNAEPTTPPADANSAPAASQGSATPSSPSGARAAHEPATPDRP